MCLVLFHIDMNVKQVPVRLHHKGMESVLSFQSTTDF